MALPSAFRHVTLLAGALTLCLCAAIPAAADAGPDAGPDAGSDAASDPGLVDDAGPGDAGQADAGDTDAGEPPAIDGGRAAQDGCGDLDHLGRCDGDLLVFCQASVEQQVDCGARGLVCAEGPPSEGFTCQEPVVEEPLVNAGCQAAGEPSAALAAFALTLALARRRRWTERRFAPPRRAS